MAEPAKIPRPNDGKIKATVSLRAVESRKCLSAHCFGWHSNGTVQNALGRVDSYLIQSTAAAMVTTAR